MNFVAASNRSVGIVWLALVTASISGFVLAEGLAPARIAATSAILLALFKVHLVFDHYMELCWHHLPLRALLAVWLAVVGAILLTSYWAA